MSDSLRDALQKRLGTLPVMAYGNGYMVEALPKAELLGLLAAHPAEPAPEVVVDHRPGETCSVAASVDPETGFTRPLLDRRAVEAAIRKPVFTRLGTYGGVVDASVDAVMELARPMPTQAELTDWLREIFTADPGGTPFGTAAEELLALLNGAES